MERDSYLKRKSNKEEERTLERYTNMEENDVFLKTETDAQLSYKTCKQPYCSLTCPIQELQLPLSS